MKENYELLGIPETITNEELEKAYKDIKRKYHPDNNLENNEEATKKFQEAQQAYDRIKEKREKVKQEYYKVYPENKDRDTFDDNFEDLQGTIFR